MSTLATTKMSSKGQVVIPEDIREKMGLHSGSQFVVLADKDVVILKMISKPSLDDFKAIILKARKVAKASGLTHKSVEDAIKEARKK